MFAHRWRSSWLLVLERQWRMIGEGVCYRSGHSYFMLHYLDKELRFPEIITVVYLGMNLEEIFGQDEHDLWFFQDAESFRLRGQSPFNRLLPVLEPDK